MIIYWIIVVSVLVLGFLMPQEGSEKKQYVLIMFFLHAFVSGCKDSNLTGDLIKYKYNYLNLYREHRLFSSYFFGSWRNALWAILNKVIGIISDYNYQIFLIVIAIITQYCVARFVLKYSSRPWMSYLVWNCLSLYFYGFHQIKQALAMAILLLAVEGLFEDNVIKYYIGVTIAGLIHAPAFLYLPMYWFVRQKMSRRVLSIYIISAGLAYIFRARVVSFMANIYYDEGTAQELLSQEGSAFGTKFFVILLMLLVGLIIKGLDDVVFRKAFLLIGVAAVLQTGASYDNIFTRYADYFLQLSIVYIPLLCYDRRGFINNNESGNVTRIIQLDDNSRDTFILALVLVLLAWFYLTVFHNVSAVGVNSILKYKFFWQT